MLIARYLRREVVKTLLFVTLPLLLILLSNQAIRYLHLVASGNLSLVLFFKLMLLELPTLLFFLLPLGLYLGILLSFGRLYAHNEMVILSGCGIGQYRRLGMLSGIILVTAMLVFIFMWTVKPKLYGYQQQLLARYAKSPLQHLLPGRFQRIPGRKAGWIYVGSRDDAALRDIFVVHLPDTIQGQSKGVRPFDMMVASTLRAKKITGHGGRFLIFDQARRYTGSPGSTDYKLFYYEQLAVPIASHLAHQPIAREKLSTGGVLFRERGKRQAMAALQWRIAIPLSVLILAIFAISLSPVYPRQGRYRKFLPALLLYVFYMQLLFMSRTWSKQEVMSAVWLFGGVLDQK